MRQGQPDIRQSTEVRKIQTVGRYDNQEDFVLEKDIFANIFEKDIRRVFIYKKAERLAKAIHLIAPAFSDSVSLKNRIDVIVIGLIDSAMLPPSSARTALSRELLALSSVLSIARTSGTLSSMNADLIAHEAHILLHEVSVYEEPRLSLDESPPLSTIAQNALIKSSTKSSIPIVHSRPTGGSPARNPLPVEDKGQIKDIGGISDNRVKDRQESILSIIKNKGTTSIKDISTLVRGISEKTIQRELSALVASGVVLKSGERRWSTYSLAQH